MLFFAQILYSLGKYVHHMSLFKYMYDKEDHLTMFSKLFSLCFSFVLNTILFCTRSAHFIADIRCQKLHVAGYKKFTALINTQS